MQPLTRNSHDYYGGALIMLIGLFSIYGGTRVEVGTLQQMGPGFFPIAVGVLLALIGPAIAVTADVGAYHADTDKKPLSIDVRGPLCIVAGMSAFIVLGIYGGLIPATFAVVFISAMGDRGNTLSKAFWLAIAAVVVAAVVFRWVLEVQLALFAWS